MAEEKKNYPLSEENRPMCSQRTRAVLDKIQVVGNLSNAASKDGSMQKKCEGGAKGSGKSDAPNNSAVPKAVRRSNVKKGEDQAFGEDNFLLSEKIEKCVVGLHQPICSKRTREVLDKTQVVGNLSNAASKDGSMQKKCEGGAKGSGKSDAPNFSAVPKAEVKKCEDQALGEDTLLLSEEIEKCVDGLQALNILVKHGLSRNRENKKMLLQEMMKKYPQMVVYQADDEDLGDFGVDFHICCKDCPATFLDLALAEKHFEDNIHDN